jgi:hypothetical protein
MDWDSNLLWSKAKLYMQRANQQERSSPLYPFWASLALELVARAALAKVHPALLADPQEGSNILYACGYPVGKKPKSIPTKTVFARCAVVIPEFTEEDIGKCMVLADQRNKELHTGAAAFEDYPTSLWLPYFLTSIAKIVNFLESDLEEFLGKEEAGAARKMLVEREQEVTGVIKKKINLHQGWFKQKTEEERVDLGEKSEKYSDKYVRKYRNCKTAACPACGSMGVITGEIGSSSEPFLDEGEITIEIAHIPTGFKCPACSLQLSGYQELHAAGLGDQFTVKQTEDPVEFHGIEPKEYIDLGDLDPADFFEPDYGND